MLLFTQALIEVTQEMPSFTLFPSLKTPSLFSVSRLLLKVLSLPQFPYSNSLLSSMQLAFNFHSFSLMFEFMPSIPMIFIFDRFEK